MFVAAKCPNGSSISKVSESDATQPKTFSIHCLWGSMKAFVAVIEGAKRISEEPTMPNLLECAGSVIRVGYVRLGRSHNFPPAHEMHGLKAAANNGGSFRSRFPGESGRFPDA
jgi:hypothetical protein